MGANDNHPKERATVTNSIEPLNNMAPLQQALEDHDVEKTEPRPTIVRCWNKTDVDRIMEDYSENIRIHATCPEPNDHEDFSISKSLLCHFSAYFRAVFMGGFTESAQKSLDINLQPEAIWVFSRWLSSGKLYCPNDPRCYVPENSVLVRLYTFADYHDIPALRRAIMLKLASPYELERFDTRVSEWQVGSCLAELPATSPLYRWLVERWPHCNSVRLGRKMRQNEDIPQELRDLVFDRATKGFGGRPCKCCHNPCNFHEHENEEEWKRTCHLLNKKVPKPDPSTYRKASRWP